MPADLRSGGFSAANVAAYEAAQEAAPVHYVGSVNPPVNPVEKALSKALRIAGLPGDFFFFSPRRLERIASEVRNRCCANAAVDYFHGFTSWIMVMPSRPYITWNDCSFRDYIDIYHRRARFSERSLKRIEEREAEWLRGANRILFTSEWAAARAIRDYGLDKGKVFSVGIFGEMPMPSVDAYAGGCEFAFASTSFKAKGGETALSAFRNVRKLYPNVSLVVVGDRPQGAASEPGITYKGFLRKEVEQEYKEFQDIMSRVRAVVHPTRSDITPQLLVEAGYFGCPVISSRKFAIAELVDDAHTGILLNDPSDPVAVADAMIRMLNDDLGYRAMRRAAWEKARTQSSRSTYQKRIREHIRAVAEAR